MTNSPTSSPNWTPPQLAAISHTHGDLLVSAAAGSGKTAVLAERCARLICQDPPADPNTPRTGIENLLVLTFTEAAAAEMRSRIAAAIRQKLAAAPPAAQPWLRRQAAMVDRAGISTLHAFCMRILRQHFHEADVDPAFDIMDEEESRLLQDETLDDLLAHWHKLPATPSATPTSAATSPAPNTLTAATFTDFFETFAQGRESICRHLILALHRMLASTAHPQPYLTTARALYGTGAATTFTAYNREVMVNHLRLARLKVHRSLDEVRPLLGTDTMIKGLGLALVALDDSIALLKAQGESAWPAINTLLLFKWPRLTTIDAITDFAGLKDRTWESTKTMFREDLAPAFATNPAGMLRDLRNLAVPLETLLELTRQFGEAFDAAKRADNRLDFSDLERLAFNLLTQPNSLARTELRQRFHYLLVDEFQDINPLQSELLNAMRNPAAAGGTGNLFVVGDIKQSIYAFRLAQPELFLERERLARLHQPADDAAPRTFVALQHNFRSLPSLLAAMNRIFEKILTPQVVGIDYPHGHDLQPPPQAAPPANAASAPLNSSPFTGTPIEVHLVTMDTGTDGTSGTPKDADDDEQPHASEKPDRPDRPGPQEDADEDEDELSHLPPPPEKLTAVEQEAQVVAARVDALLAENRTVREKGQLTPLRPRHIAILLRTMKNKAMIFARALADRGIRVHADLSSGFFDTPEVKQALALLQVLDNPQQDIPLATVLLGPYGRFTHDDLSLLRLSFDRKEVPFSAAVAGYPLPLDPHEALPASAATSAHRLQTPYSADLAARLRALFATLDRWRDLLRARPLHEGLAEIFAESRIFAYLAGLDAGTQRVANLQLLHQRALKFSTFKKQGLHRFLRFIERLRDQESGGFGGRGGDIGEAPVLSEASDVVRILSIHKSKGLEFPVVFVSGLGAKLRLTAPGPVLLHRDLGVGLYVNDLERNISYPSAAALRIADNQKRAFRAEELRLLYVALTRARECLILTGHVAKSADIDRWRNAFSNSTAYQNPLPEDLLLKGSRALDWLMPALATGADPAAAPQKSTRLTIAWDPAAPAASSAQIVVHQHAPQPQSATAPDPDSANAALIARIVAAEPLAAPTPDPRVDRMIERLTSTYAFEHLAQRPAVQTVSYLKSQDHQAADETPATLVADLPSLPEFEPANLPVEPDAADLADTAPVSLEEGPPADPAPAAPAPDDAAAIAQAIHAARLRGIATHRILELLDFTRCHSPDALHNQLQSFLNDKRLTPEQLARADLPGIRWFLWHSQTGTRILAAARAIAAGDSSLHLRREIPFTWLAEPNGSQPTSSPPTSSHPASSPPTGPLEVPPSGGRDPADLPTIRGVIDLLLVNTANRTAEILDYKTDSQRLWQTRTPDYQRQMHYYLAAASDILGFPVRKATLIFLSPRQEMTVANL